MKVTFIGLGGHAGNLIDICNIKGYEIAGYIDDKVENNHYQKLDAVIGAAILGYGALSPEKLEERYKILASNESHFVILYHPSAIISPTAAFGDGVQIMAGAIIQHNAQVDSGSIINTGAIVEHDVIIGKGCHIAPRATVLGDVEIGNFCFIGSGATIVQGSKIPAHTFVRAGELWKQ